MGNYATLAATAARLLPSTYQSSTDDPILTSLLAGASRAIDRYCKVADGFFDTAPAQGAEFAKTLVTDWSDRLVLPPLVSGSIVSITADGVAVAGGNYRQTENWLYGLQGGVLTPWGCGTRLTITARWGWAATPSDVTEACIQIVLRWFRGRDDVLTQASALGGQAMVIERAIPAAAKMLLENMRSELIRHGWVRP